MWKLISKIRILLCYRVMWISKKADVMGRPRKTSTKLRYWISDDRWKVMWIFEKANAVGVLGQIPLLAEITSRISNYARDIRNLTKNICYHFERYSLAVLAKIYIVILRNIFYLAKIYILILRDICCFAKIYIVSLIDIHCFAINIYREFEKYFLFCKDIYSHFERYLLFCKNIYRQLFLLKYISSFWEIFTVLAKIYIVILRYICCFAKIYVVILRDIRCFC